MKRSLQIMTGLLLLNVAGYAAPGQPFELSPDWEQKILQIAPVRAPAKPKADRKVLVFSLNTGFKHWCIPHTSAMVQILGEKSGGYTTVQSNDIEEFLPENVSQYDAIVLNNNCPQGSSRDIFLDTLVHKIDEFGAKYKERPLEEREALALKLYNSLTSYIAEGGV